MYQCVRLYKKLVICIVNSYNFASIAVSTEIFDWDSLYLLVGKVGDTKNETEVQEF